MILTVTLNPAIDITYHVTQLRPGQTHRVSRVDERLGGKGINVASVLSQLGVPALATGLLRDGPPSFSPIAAPPRRTVAVTDGVDATGFWEQGPTVSADEWAAFQAHFARLLPGAAVVVLSGSLPPGLPDAAYGSLIALAREAGAKTILDSSGLALAWGVAAAPDIVKPNAAELAELTAMEDGRLLSNLDSRTTAVVSDGPDGLTAKGFRARPPRRLEGNPTGAGDACVAALARGLLAGTPWPDLLRDAVALSAAAVASPVAGLVDLDVYRGLLPGITLEAS